MRHLISGIIALILLSNPIMAQKTAIFDNLIFSNAQGSIPYRLLKPEIPEASRKYPLIIFLHGAGERGDDNEAQIKHIQDLVLDVSNREKYPCYVLTPQCPKGELWAKHAKDGSMLSSPTEPMQLAISLIDEILAKFPIDPARIYLTGVSMGGYGTWDLLARFPEKFAAGVPVCGGGDVHSVSKFKNVPVWAFHGTLDQIVVPSQSRRMIEALRKEGGKPGYTEYPGIAHNSWVQAYQEPYLLPWLFRQKISAINE